MKRPSRLLALLLPAAVSLFGASPGRADEAEDEGGGAPPIGLSVFFNNGAIQPLQLVGDAPRYLQEIDITAQVTTPTDQGIDALVASGALGDVDWSGVRFVDEDWRSADGVNWTRQRFYRGARWMQQRSAFEAIALDKNGEEVGAPIVFNAGLDDHWDERSDDGFVRRFEARQIVKNCKAQFDCSNATAFEAQALVQARQEQHVGRRARVVPREATELQLRWTEDPSTKRSVPLTHAHPSDFPYGYGFEPRLQITNPPGNGHYYVPGETLAIRVGYFDGQGNQLNHPGSLPTYQQANIDRAPAAAGIKYWDPTLDTVLYYALKHREGNMILEIDGPTDRLKVPTQLINGGTLFGPQATIADVPHDGFSAEITIIPPIATIFDPSQWQHPNSDIQTLTIPGNALPGTYTAGIKARREWGGEALNRGVTVDFQVGQAATTAYAPGTGNCDSCHKGRSDFNIVNHGLDDRRACVGCHAALSFEPDNRLDVRIHSIHSRDERFPGSFSACSTCHLSPPSGPAAGQYKGDPDGAH